MDRAVTRVQPLQVTFSKPAAVVVAGAHVHAARTLAAFLQAVLSRLRGELPLSGRAAAAFVQIRRGAVSWMPGGGQAVCRERPGCR